MNELFDYLSTADNWWGRQGIVRALYDHVRLSGLATLIAVVIAVPPAVVLGHARRGGFLAVSVVNIGRAMPSFAILALVFPLSLRYGFGLGFWPTAVALVLLAVPPIFTNAYTGVRDVDPGVVGAATGMGMSARQVLAQVEVPNAVPLIVTGVRIAAVQVVATATLGALFGFGGLGALITKGYAQQDNGKLLTGALFVALLAVVTEVAFGALERRLTPWAGRRPDPSQLSVTAPDPPSVLAT
ncbi:MAG: ABC transporter permease [Actinomycetota bacterium]|nr:ABC transporter permease [Actinomycetota bacterium]